MHRKLNHLGFTPYTEECALSLAIECNVPSDAMIPSHVRLVHYGENIFESFGYSDGGYEEHMADDQVKFRVKALESQLRDWRASVPLSAAEICEYSEIMHPYFAQLRFKALFSAIYGMWLK
jgi:hypothetical protein